MITKTLKSLIELITVVINEIRNEVEIEMRDIPRLRKRE